MARVVTNQRISFEKIAEEMCENTTLNPAIADEIDHAVLEKIVEQDY